MATHDRLLSVALILVHAFCQHKKFQVAFSQTPLIAGESSTGLAIGVKYKRVDGLWHHAGPEFTDKLNRRTPRHAKPRPKFAVTEDLSEPIYSRPRGATAPVSILSCRSPSGRTGGMQQIECLGRRL
jgi:hypothetical protein